MNAPDYLRESVLQYYAMNRDLVVRASRVEAVTALLHLYSKKFGLNHRPLKQLCDQAYADRRLVGRYLFHLGTEIR